MESLIGHMMFSIPAVEGLESGSGFAGSCMRGSEHNDMLITTEGKTNANNAGGINGGITNGNNLAFRIAVKPTSSTHLKQHTINLIIGQMVDLEIEEGMTPALPFACR